MRFYNIEEVQTMNTKIKFINDDFRISQESIDSGWTMPYAHYHASYEIYILKSGERTVTIENKEYIAKAHDTALFPSNIPHKSKGDVPFSGICIHFSERYLDLYFTANAKKELMRCFKNSIISLSDDDFSTIKKLADDFVLYAQDNFVILSVILNILNHSAIGNNAGLLSEREKKMSKSQLIMQYVEDNYIFIKHISDITDIFHVSETYIFQIYRNKYYMTPKQYINKLRIRHACHRLKYTDYTIKSIALNSGFDSYEYFINVFKKLLDCTPTEYRNRNYKTII